MPGGAADGAAEERPPWSAGAIRDGRRRCSRGSSRRRARATVPASCSAARGGPARRRSAARNRGRTCSKASRPGRDAGTAPRTAAPAARSRQRSSSPRRATQGEPDVVAPGEAAGQRHGVVARAPGPRRDGGDVERQVERLARHRSDLHSSMCGAGGRAPGTRRARTPRPGAARSARSASSVRTAARPGGDVVDVERVDDAGGRGPGRTEVVHARHLVGHHRRCADPHGLERRQPVALGQRHVGEGAGPPVELGEDGVGHRAGEDDCRRRPGARGGSGPHPVGPTITSGHGPGSERAHPARRPARAGPRSCAARACPR